MEKMKELVFQAVDQQSKELCEMSDFIFDHPEGEGKEVLAAEAITGYLKNNGFHIEMGVGGFDTAFRAVYKNKEGGPSIGILCEYDALKGIGHACGHHMQGPACAGAAVAIQRACKDEPYQLVVYGTPAEETLSAKCAMSENGCFQDIDVALMMHAGTETNSDVKNLAYMSYIAEFHGKKSHAAAAPEAGRSALDALLVAFQGVEFLREHVTDDTRMHYTIQELPGPANVVPEKAVGKFALRSFSRENLESVAKRFEDIIKGASLIAGVEYELKLNDFLFNKIPVLKLNNLLLDNAELAGTPRLAPPRTKTGSSDFGNVMYRVPGSCIRIAVAPEGTALHSNEFLNVGKSEDLHKGIVFGAKAIAGASLDMITDENLRKEIREEFTENKEKFK